jgi:hypothetical protein
MSLQPKRPMVKLGIVHHSPTLQILDARPALPSHPEKAYGQRPLSRIKYAIWHHSAGAVRPGLSGPIGTARTHVTERDWPGIAYHYYIPYLGPPRGPALVYSCQSLRTWAYHTGPGYNDTGIGVVCQGCFASRHNPKQGPFKGQPTPGPSDHQQVASWELWIYLQDRFPAIELAGHYLAGKPTCPGDELEAWIEEVRECEGWGGATGGGLIATR